MNQREHKERAEELLYEATPGDHKYQLRAARVHAILATIPDESPPSYRMVTPPIEMRGER